MSRGAGVAPRQQALRPVRTQDVAPAETLDRKVLLPDPPKYLGRGHDLDSRLQRPKMTSDGTLERMYCVSCGAPSGWVTTEVVSIATYVCLACTATHGPLPLPRLDIPE